MAKAVVADPVKAVASGAVMNFVQDVEAVAPPRIDDHLTDIMMAQDFHDLTGQVVAKVVALANDLEDSLVKLLVQVVPPDQREKVDPNVLQRPGGRRRRPHRRGGQPGRGRRPAGQPGLLTSRVRRPSDLAGVHERAKRPRFNPLIPRSSSRRRRRNNGEAPHPVVPRHGRSRRTRPQLFPPPPRKLQKAREDGQVARSRDLGHFAALAAGGAALVAAGAGRDRGWLQACWPRAALRRRGCRPTPASWASAWPSWRRR